MIVVVGMIGIVSGLVLLQQRQNINEEAAVPDGRATVSLAPEFGTFNVGESIPVDVFFNTDGVPISQISVVVTYPFSGASPELKAGDIQINPSFLGSGEWSCPTKSITEQSGTVSVNIGCANISATGYSTTFDTKLATFTVDAERVPASNPTVVRFDPAKSIITQKSNQEDILLIPEGEGSYEIIGETTPTPTTVVTVTPSPTTAVTSTPTPTTVTTNTPTPTAAQLPDSGVSTPFVFSAVAGVLMLAGALALAL